MEKRRSRNFKEKMKIRKERKSCSANDEVREVIGKGGRKLRVGKGRMAHVSKE